MKLLLKMFMKIKMKAQSTPNRVWIEIGLMTLEDLKVRIDTISPMKKLSGKTLGSPIGGRRAMHPTAPLHGATSAEMAEVASTRSNCLRFDLKWDSR